MLFDRISHLKIEVSQIISYENQHIGYKYKKKSFESTDLSTQVLIRKYINYTFNKAPGIKY